MVLRSSDYAPASNIEMLKRRLAFRDNPPDGARELAAAAPQIIFTSTTEALFEGRLLEDAVPTAWQYVLVANGELAGVAEVSHSGPGGESPRSFDVLRPAKRAEAINKVVAIAETLPGEYEFRMLRVPNLYLLAVWLRNAGCDLLLPVAPVPSVLGKIPIYTEQALIRALRPLAIQRRAIADVKR
jgi:hypothetical protein